LRLRLAPVVSGDGVGFATEPSGLDFGSVMAIAQARGADLVMLAEVLPRAEAVIVEAYLNVGGGDE